MINECLQRRKKLLLEQKYTKLYLKSINNNVKFLIKVFHIRSYARTKQKHLLTRHNIYKMQQFRLKS